jgi:uncharacterized membrane protein HdeD (DUF308 family)
MTDHSFTDSLFHGRLRAASGRLMWLGVAMVVVGIAAIVFPIAATLVATLLVGWVLLFSGVVTFAAAFSIHGTGPFFAALLLGLISVAVGVFLIFNPLAGTIALTLMVGVLFMFQGAYEIYFALHMRPHAGWVGMLISGIASVVMALLITAGWPGISVILLGILLGVNFISTGLGYIAVSRAVKPLA